MSASDLKTEQRIDELLIDQAIGGLDAEQQNELRTLLAGEPEPDRNPYMETAALVQLGIASMEQAGGRRAQGMPQRLRSRLRESAAEALSGAANVSDPDGAAGPEGADVIDIAPRRQERSAVRRGGPLQYAGWAVAAAFALAFVVVSADPQPASSESLSRSELLAATDSIVIPWAGAESGYEAVSGDVVWNDDMQQGYMRLSGLPANNPAESQYQLWIVDPDRSAEPVDGGVFDIPAGGGDVIVPVTAKLQVDDPAAFAITLEKPGGVVVSAGPLLVVAAES